MHLLAAPCTKAQIWLLFYSPNSGDHWLNRLVAAFDGPFSHVEIAFDEKYGHEPWERDMLGSSIYQGETVFLQSKRYSRAGYVPISIEVTQNQLERIRHYCHCQARQRVGFSAAAMYLSYLPVQLYRDHWGGTFCSKHVTAALQEASVDTVAGLNSSLVTPSSLYRHVACSRASPIVQVVPHRLQGGASTEWGAKMLAHIMA
jgi:hypothetical protein